MDIFLNYVFIGFILTFLLDYLSDILKKDPLFHIKVPSWTWGARIMFALFWPLGISLFVYVYIKEITK